MNKINLITLSILVFILFCCKNEKKEDIILNSAGKEWRLERFNEKSKIIDFNRLFLVFHKNYTYEIYRKENNLRVDSSSDVVIDHSWSIDSVGQLNIASFQKLKLLKLTKNNLVFKFGKEKYDFVCKDCK